MCFILDLLKMPEPPWRSLVGTVTGRMRSFMEEELDDAELDGEEEVGAQPGASASCA